jgi:hypothetical protein
MKKSIVAIMLILTFGTSAWADLYEGSLSTPILFDMSSFTTPPTPYDERTPLENTPGGLTATAAWDQYGMRLDWSVTRNTDNTYTYSYYFGPGWFPPNNGTKSNPWITNKQITALDLQLGNFVTMADISAVAWSVFDYKNTLLGYGTADQYSFIDQTTHIETTGSAAVMNVGDLKGNTGNAVDGYTSHSLFHGLQWINPMENGNFVFSNDVNLILTFESATAPGWGNFFANSTQTGSERNYEDVVAYDPFNSNTVSVPGGAPVPVPPAILLFGSGLVAMGVLRRRKSVV